MAKEMNGFPRIIVDMDEPPWNKGPHSNFMVAQVLILKRDKDGIQRKSFVNVSLVAGNSENRISAVIDRIDSPSDSAKGPINFDLRMKLTADSDEDTAINGYKLDVLG